MLIHALLLPLAAASGTHHNLISDDTREYLDTALKRWGIPGTAAVVVAGPAYTRGDWATEYYNYGVADSKGTPVSEHTLFSIGSNSKLFTALSVLSLMGNATEHALTPGSKMKDILPEWGLMDPEASENANITDIASMLSGVPAHGLAIGHQSDSESVSQMRFLKPSAPLRGAYQYNNWHYRVLSHIVTTVSGTPFVDWVQANFLSPLGMKSTTYNYTGVTKADGFTHEGVNATQCAASPDLEHLEGCAGTPLAFGWWVPDPWDGSGAGEGGVITNTCDLAKWFKELLAPQVIPPAAIALAVTPWVPILPPMDEMGAYYYGAGQMISTYRNHTIYLHNGQRPGHASLFVRLPEKQLAVGIWANENVYSALFPLPLQQVLVGRITDSLLGLPPIPAENRFLAIFKDLFAASPQASLADIQTAAGAQSGATGGSTRPANPTPPPAEVAGSWSNPAYGNFTFASLPASEANTPAGAIAANLPALGIPVEGVLWAKYDGYLTHLTAAHFDGPLWNLTAWEVYEHDGRVVIPSGQPFVGVVTDEGMGWWGTVLPGSGVNVTTPTTKNLTAAAEVFFTRA